MVFNRFVISVILRMVILILTIVIFSFIMVVYRDRPVLFILIGILFVMALEIYGLIHYILHTNRQVTRFLTGLKNADFTVKFSGMGLARSFNELADIMNETVELLRELRLEKETQIHLLKMITADIKTGIISFNSNGKMVLMNYKAQKLLELSDVVKTWSELRVLNPSFVKEAELIKNNGNTFTEIKVGKEMRKVSLSLNTIPLLEDKIRVITIEDIQNQIEMQESDAWLKLTRILMHEIMNSVTPLTSLTETMGNILNDKSSISHQPFSISGDEMDDIKYCLENIQRRKDHLMLFVENYRRLAHLPHPEKKMVNAFDLINSVCYCLHAEFSKSNIEIAIDKALQGMNLWVDESQIEQVLINLMRNSIYALQKSEIKKIEITGMEKEQYMIIQVTDTGEGIPAEKLNDIFVPFYSTKENGSGIGLGLSRQIMLAHQGSIRVQSELNSGSTFSLWFLKPAAYESIHP